MAKIIYTNYYVPRQMISAEEVMSSCQEIAQAEVDSFLEQSGLDKIAIADKELINVFEQLLEECLQKVPIDKSKIRYLIYTNPLNEKYGEKVSIPYYIQKKFELDNCSVVIMDQKCSTSLESLYFSNLICNQREDEYVLILSPCFLKYQTLQDRFIGFTICGDAAAIGLIGCENEKNSLEIVDIHSKSDGTFSFMQLNNDNTSETSYSGVDERIVIIQKGVNLIKELLSGNGVDIEKVKYVIPQSINKYAYGVYAKFLKIAQEKMYLENVSMGGHLGDADTLRNLHDILHHDCLEDGDYIVLYGLGSDGTDINYSALLCKYTKS